MAIEKLQWFVICSKINIIAGETSHGLHCRAKELKESIYKMWCLYLTDEDCKKVVFIYDKWAYLRVFFFMPSIIKIDTPKKIYTAKIATRGVKISSSTLKNSSLFKIRSKYFAGKGSMVSVSHAHKYTHRERRKKQAIRTF